MIIKNIKEQVEYLNSLKQGKVITYVNVDDFPELSSETAQFLKKYGVYSDEWNIPYVILDGALRRFKNNLIEIGQSDIGSKYCIDTETENLIIYHMHNNKSSIVNSSIETFLKSQYVLTYYSMEIEGEKYGEFYEDENYKKYAKLLREMLNEVEPSGIQNFLLWEEIIHEKELGVC